MSLGWESDLSPESHQFSGLVIPVFLHHKFSHCLWCPKYTADFENVNYSPSCLINAAATQVILRMLWEFLLGEDVVLQINCLTPLTAEINVTLWGAARIAQQVSLPAGLGAGGKLHVCVRLGHFLALTPVPFLGCWCVPGGSMWSPPVVSSLHLRYLTKNIK